MQRIVLTTGDGSPTIAIPDMQVTYHSRYGAIQESRHVFIQAGLRPLLYKYEPLTVFEMGFGTGLNALLTLQLAMAHQQSVYYHAVDLYPLQPAEAVQLEYATVLPRTDFLKLHNCPWDKATAINDYFTLWKYQSSVQDFFSTVPFQLIYYDAFAPSAQPELWTKEMFEKLYNMLDKSGVLVTYCSKGEVRRSMLAAGFAVEKLKGPPGKREMLRAIKL